MKKTIIIFTLILFAFSTLVMPYANYDDTHSLQVVYNNCLEQDSDMDFAEFIGGKLLSAGLGEEEEDNNTHRANNTTHTAIVEIQTGALFQQYPEKIDLEQPPVIILSIPLSNTDILSHDFHPGIFHPPAFA